jgi:superfamily II DNA or RNA helicase
MRLDTSSIARWCGADRLSTAVWIYRSGFVKWTHREGDDVTGEVAMSPAKPALRLKITFSHDERTDALTALSTCECGGKGFCVHAGAILLAHRASNPYAPLPACAAPKEPRILVGWDTKGRIAFAVPGCKPGVTITEAIKTKWGTRPDGAALEILGLLLDRCNRGMEHALQGLDAVAATGHGRWAPHGTTPVIQGPPQPAWISWATLADGSQIAHAKPVNRLKAHGDPGHEFYLDAKTGTYGRFVQVGEVDPMAGTIGGNTKISDESSDSQQPCVIDARLKNGELTDSVDHIEDLTAKAMPRLRVEATKDGKNRRGLISWTYGPFTADDRKIHPEGAATWQGRLVTATRDPAAEQRILDEAAAAGLQIERRSRQSKPLARPGLTAKPPKTSDGQQDWIDFLLNHGPKLSRLGWQFDLPSDLIWAGKCEIGQVSATCKEAEDGQFLDVHMTIMSEQRTTDLLPAVIQLAALAMTGETKPGKAWVLGATDGIGGTAIVPVSGGSLAVPYAQIKPFIDATTETIGDATIRDGRFRIGRMAFSEAADLADEAIAADAAWIGGETALAAGRRLPAAATPTRHAPPSDLTALLPPYQEEGLGWLEALAALEMGGVLADDMGLGKTVQALAHIMTQREKKALDGPALVVCPKSLVPNWAAEVRKFAPSLNAVLLDGPKREKEREAAEKADIVITSYGILERDKRWFMDKRWGVAIFDEAQALKTRSSTARANALALATKRRVCLTGTPLENHLGELWSIVDCACPGFLGTEGHFNSRFRRPIEREGNKRRMETLRRRLRPIMLRRRKAEVAADLPPKIETTHLIAMSDAQRATYEHVRLKALADIEAAEAETNGRGNGVIVVAAMLRLRQVCCDPRLTPEHKPGTPSAKMDRLLAMLPEMVEQGRRILLFSQFTSMLDLIERGLDKIGMPRLRLDGKTQDRSSPVTAFESGQAPLFLISLKTGGRGLNLTSADAVIHYDPWWNPSVEDQATDRAHRIGQTRTVFVHRLTMAGTIEAKMDILKARKATLLSSIIDGINMTRGQSFRREEIDYLFSPD